MSSELKNTNMNASAPKSLTYLRERRKEVMDKNKELMSTLGPYYMLGVSLTLLDFILLGLSDIGSYAALLLKISLSFNQ